MSDISPFVSYDSRPLAARMRRHRLYQIANAYGLQYEKDAPKTQMLKLFEAHNIDVLQPLPNGEEIPLKQTVGKDEAGRDQVQIWPDEPVPEQPHLHPTDVKRINEQRQQEHEARVTEDQEQTTAALGRILNFMERLDRRLSTVEDRVKEQKGSISGPTPIPPSNDAQRRGLMFVRKNPAATLAEIASYAKVSQHTVSRWRYLGVIPTKQLPTSDERIARAQRYFEQDRVKVEKRKAERNGKDTSQSG